MTPTQPVSPWRGYVHQLTYGADLTGPLDDDAVERIVEGVLRQRVFTQPIEAYYEAASAALASGEHLADLPNQDDAAVRDALIRIVDRLDARRPWPVPPFQQQGVEEWGALAGAPVIGRIPLSQMQVRRTLNRLFDTVEHGGGELKVLVLRLRTGQLVALRSTGAFTAPGVDLLSGAEPGSTAADFTELTGMPLEPS
ncbi:hypothetical protein [Pseudonocardia humida]|uniref:hypothetical protein n=1 Tax=Pseudonocardia humida TaxID=2800819 RepID=UPI00207CFE55|nr:hypothetical protein [Pseudonocardia humida]